MTKRAVASLAFALLAVVCAFSYVQRAEAASYALRNALSSLRYLNDNQFSAVVYWSRNGTSRPYFPSNPEQQAEQQILDLNGQDRNAVLAWLRGNGRDQLYNRGATDSEIGGRRPAAMSPSAPSTPNPYRRLTFSSPTIGGGPMGHIVVLSGWAAVKRDGTAAVVCISFKNVAKVPARRVVFDFPIFGPQGGKVGELHLDRRGEFSPGIDINGWPDLGSWQGGVGNRGYGDNCNYVQQGMSSTPLLRAEGATYEVQRVEFDDGRVWPRGGY